MLDLSSLAYWPYRKPNAIFFREHCSWQFLSLLKYAQIISRTVFLFFKIILDTLKKVFYLLKRSKQEKRLINRNMHFNSLYPRYFALFRMYHGSGERIVCMFLAKKNTFFRLIQCKINDSQLFHTSFILSTCFVSLNIQIFFFPKKWKDCTYTAFAKFDKIIYTFIKKCCRSSST